MADELELLGHGVEALLLDLGEPVPGAAVDGAEVLAEDAESAAPGHEDVSDPSALLVSDVVHDTEVVADADAGADTAEGGVEAVVHEGALLVNGVGKELSGGAAVAEGPAEDLTFVSSSSSSLICHCRAAAMCSLIIILTRRREEEDSNR